MKYQGFYDSVISSLGVADRPYTAKDFCMHLRALIGNGIGLTKATGDNAWKVEQIGDLTVKVTLGQNGYNFASLNGNPFAVDEELTLDLFSGDDRWDSIMIRANGTSEVRLTDIVVQEGSVDLTRNEDVYDLRLARIHIVNNAIVEIIDDRLNYECCGIANGLATVPTEELIELLNSVANGESVALKTGILQENLNAELLNNLTLEQIFLEMKNRNGLVQKYNVPTMVPAVFNHYTDDLLSGAWTTVTENEQYTKDDIIINVNATKNASQIYDSEDFSVVLDNNITSDYCVLNKGNVVFDMGKVIKPTFSLYIKRGNATKGNIYGSENGTTWILIEEKNLTSAGENTETWFDFSSNSYYRYYKIEWNDIYFRLYSIKITEYYLPSAQEFARLSLDNKISAYEKYMRALVTIPSDIPSGEFTSSIIPIGFNASNTSIDGFRLENLFSNSGDTAYALFDKNPDTYDAFRFNNDTGAAWELITFPILIKPKKLKLKYRVYNANAGSNATINIYGRNDNGEEILLHTETHSGVMDVIIDREVEITNTDFIRTLSMNTTGFSTSSENRAFYEIDIVSGEAELYNPNVTTYININNLGDVLISSSLEIGKKYELIYDGTMFNAREVI